jgi:hypothetical protein
MVPHELYASYNRTSPEQYDLLDVAVCDAWQLSVREHLDGHAFLACVISPEVMTAAGAGLVQVAASPGHHNP